MFLYALKAPETKRQYPSHKDKGDLVFWYETITEPFDNNKTWKKKNSYSTKPESLNLEKYKRLLLTKLNDTLEIAGFNIAHVNPMNSGMIITRSVLVEKHDNLASVQ